MLSRLQRSIVLALLAAAFAWLAWQWASPVRAWMGFFAILFFHAIVLALEFVLLRQANRADPVQQATAGQLARAWLAESLLMVRVFGWRQPFRPNAVPDDARPDARGRRGVVLVHGFVCNRGFWTPWLRALRREGHPFVAVNLEPVFGSIENYAPVIDAAVRQMAAGTGQAPVVVCHSMGGLAVRAWLRSAQAAERVHHVVTIGTPHRGTWLGRFSRRPNGRQMRLEGTWVDELARAESPRLRTKFTCWYSNCDNIVFPSSTATLPGADNRLLQGPAHVELAFHPHVMAASLALLAAP